MEFFKVSEYSVKSTRKLRNERGILATPKKYSREGIGRATKLLITKFYECDAGSCICSGKKGFCKNITRKMVVEKGLKKLMLANFTEIYALFKSKNSKFIIWSLDFCSSLPEMAQTCRCIRLPQCLCMHYHQNVRLMIYEENPSLDNKNTLKLCVCCDITNHSCVLYHCDLCPNTCVGREFLMGQLWNNNYSPSDSIKNQRWVSRDRSQLQDNEKDFHDFLANLLPMLFKLTEHHFIAKSQIIFSRSRKIH